MMAEATVDHATSAISPALCSNGYDGPAKDEPEKQAVDFSSRHCFSAVAAKEEQKG
jgi:hypothetical protein